jgi:hypothetical protein
VLGTLGSMWNEYALDALALTTRLFARNFYLYTCTHTDTCTCTCTVHTHIYTHTHTLSHSLSTSLSYSHEHPSLKRHAWIHLDLDYPIRSQTRPCTYVGMYVCPMRRRDHVFLHYAYHLTSSPSHLHSPHPRISTDEHVLMYQTCHSHEPRGPKQAT